MKKLIVVFSRFLLVSILVYCLVIIVLYKCNVKIFSTNIPGKDQRRTAFTARKLEDAANTKNSDLVILGSSLAYRNYHPQILKKEGLSSLSLGTSSQKPNMTYVMAMRYLDRIDGKLVVIDVNPYLMLMPDTYETIDVIMNSSKSKYDWDLLIAEPSLMAFNSLIIKYSGFAEKDRMEKLKDSSLEENTYLGNGSVASTMVYDSNKKTPNITISDFQPSQDQVEALENTIEFLKSRKINFVLVLSPANEHYFVNRSKISLQEFKKLSRTYFSKYGNYYDSNDLAQYQQTDFMDFSHLNETGAKKFTNSLIPILKKNIK